MYAPGRSTREELLATAQNGAPESLGQLLELYRNYLGLLASAQIDRKLKVRCSPSDIVQETFLEAHRDFHQFSGRSEAEFLGWLRRILVNNLLRAFERHVTTQRRCVRREISLQEMGDSLDRSTARLEAVLADGQASVSSQLRRQESAMMLAEQLKKLAPDYREVLVLRHLQGLPFADVAEQMGRSPGAVRMLWLRAIAQLRERMSDRGQP